MKIEIDDMMLLSVAGCFSDPIKGTHPDEHAQFCIERALTLFVRQHDKRPGQALDRFDRSCQLLADAIERHAAEIIEKVKKP